jgi:hypothetical protein
MIDSDGNVYFESPAVTGGVFWGFDSGKLNIFDYLSGILKKYAA